MPAYVLVQMPRFVLLEFPSVEQARAWWASPEYAAAKALRHASAHSEMLRVEGLPAGLLDAGVPPKTS